METPTQPPGTEPETPAPAPAESSPAPEPPVEPAPDPAPAPAEPAREQTPDERTAEERAAATFYCPGCGKPFEYQGECVGAPAAPHPPIPVVSTDELSGDDADKLTAAPPGGE